MKKQNFNQLFKKALPLAIVFFVIAFSQHAQASTSFTSQQDGNWNDAATWGNGGESFSGPFGVTFDSSGNMYVADTYNNRIVELNPNTDTEIASFTDLTTAFNGPFGVTFDSSGNMYVADTYNNRIVELNPNTDTEIASFTDLTTAFSGPTGVTFDSSGNMYVADTNNNRIVELNPNTDTEIASFTDLTTAFSYPTGVTFDSSGNMYVADQNNNRIVELNPNTDTEIASFTDLTTAFSYPYGVTFDSSGNMYVADQNNNRIVELNPNTDTEIASFTDLTTAFSYPYGVTFDSSGNMYVADSGNSRIVELNPNTDTEIASFTNPTIASVEGSNYPGASDDATVENNVTLASNQSVHNLTIDGTLDLAGHTLNVSGNFTNNGTFAADNGTINLTGTNQTISGNNTFYNLTKTTSSADTLYFEGGTQTVTGVLSLNGATGNLLSLHLAPHTSPTFALGAGSWTQGSAALGVAVDSSGNVYVVDQGNNDVTKLSPSGTILTTFTAGGALSSPYGIALDSSGNMYVAEYGAVVEMDPSGNVLNTFAADSGLSYTRDIALDSSNNIYVADTYNNRVVEMDSSGTVQNVFTAGGALSYPYGIALDSSGNMYVANTGYNNVNNVIEMDPSGNVLNTFTAGGALLYPNGIALDSSGNMYVANTGYNNVIEMDPSGNVLNTFTAGGALPNLEGLALDPSGNIYITYGNPSYVVKMNSSGTVTNQFTIVPPIANGAFEYQAGVTTDSQGNVYVSDCGSDADANRIQKFDASGNFVTAWGSFGAGDGQFNCPYGLVHDSHNNIYVVDAGNNRIQKFDSNGNFITSWGSFGDGDGQFNNPYDITIDSSDNVYVADQGSNRIQKFDSNGNFISMWGWGVQDGASQLETCTSDCQSGIYGDGAGQFYNPEGITIDSSGNIYIADTENQRIQKFDSNGNFISMWGWGVQDGASQLETCTSDCQSGIYGDGAGQFNYPASIAVDSLGTVYVYNGDGLNSVQTFDTSGNYFGQWGGQGSGDNDFGDYVLGLATDNQNNVYVVDAGYTDFPDVPPIKKFSPTTSWSIDPQGSVSVSYLSVTGSTNSAVTPIDCTTGCTDGGGNVNWTFASAPSPTPTPVSDSGGPAGNANIVPNNSSNSSGTNLPSSGLKFPSSLQLVGSSFPSNTLVLDKGTIYLIEGQTKTGFTTMKAFVGLGYKLKYVVKGDTSSYSLSSYLYTTPNMAHVPGSWLIHNKTVYYSTSSGLIPIPSWNIFLNNGGQAQFIVQANGYDLAFPMLPMMTVGDARVNH